MDARRDLHTRKSASQDNGAIGHHHLGQRRCRCWLSTYLLSYIFNHVFHTHLYTHLHTHWHTLTLSVVCRWPSFNALEKWFDCASSAAQFAVEFLYKLGLPLMASSTSPSHLLTPALLWQWEGERECFVCASNLWFEMWLWKANLAKYLLPLPLPASWPASFGFIFSLAFVSLDISLLPLSDYFFFIFYFLLCCPFADKHIRVLLFFVFCCALYLLHFYLFALRGWWFVGYVDDAVLFVKHAKRCFDSRTRAWAGQPQSGWSSLKTLTQSKVE